jgi:hypothetical protein
VFGQPTLGGVFGDGATGGGGPRPRTLVAARPAAAAAAPRGPSELTLPQFVAAVDIFLRAYLMLNGQNRLAVFAYGPAYTALLASNLEAEAEFGDGWLQDALRRAQPECAARAADAAPPADAGGDDAVAVPRSALAAALAAALCFSQRFADVLRFSSLGRRVLVLSCSADALETFVPFTNCAFTAQRLGVVVDACALTAAETPLLQQAAFLTGGVYKNLLHQKHFLHFLLSVYGVDLATRSLLRLPKIENTAAVDARAICFCHKRPVTGVGLVCSVCASPSTAKSRPSAAPAGRSSPIREWGNARSV